MTEIYQRLEPDGQLRTINLLTVVRMEDPSDPTDSPWRVQRVGSSISAKEWEGQLIALAETLNNLEEQKHALITDLLKVKETQRSLQEDLRNFSTFEQICNSGMLRNFKIDSESPFAQVILSLLQQTMELQISHLQSRRQDGPDGTNIRTSVPEG